MQVTRVHHIATRDDVQLTSTQRGIDLNRACNHIGEISTLRIQPIAIELHRTASHQVTIQVAVGTVLRHTRGERGSARIDKAAAITANT